MGKAFEELDYSATPLGELVLRRRKIPMLDDEVVYEIILNGEFLMSSLFHVVEEALADLGWRRHRRVHAMWWSGGWGLATRQPPR